MTWRKRDLEEAPGTRTLKALMTKAQGASGGSVAGEAHSEGDLKPKDNPQLILSLFGIHKMIRFLKDTDLPLDA